MSHVLDGLECADRRLSSLTLDDYRKEGADCLLVVADFDYTLTARRGENGEPGCLTHQCFDASKLLEKNSTIEEMVSYIEFDQFHDIVYVPLTGYFYVFPIPKFPLPCIF
ncbi:unnamed protein product [Strongylus vulgaris]|uniref:5'-nucleotidase n=1 Tax=Strongylus vulgaris TaxID=40348 RepID=A0A3P7KTS6_STRVU|nr:unnamed protein product [Strongylus vulgaris]